MTWHIEIEPSARKDLDKMGSHQSQRILRFLSDRIALLDNPRCLGEGLSDPRMGYVWRWRSGRYRIISHIQDPDSTIFVKRVRHRRESYVP